MKPIKLSLDLFDTFEDNVESLNEILKYWCNENLSYDRYENSIKIDLDLLQSILSKSNFVSNIQRYVPGRALASNLSNYLLQQDYKFRVSWEIDLIHDTISVYYDNPVKTYQIYAKYKI